MKKLDSIFFYIMVFLCLFSVSISGKEKKNNFTGGFLVNYFDGILTKGYPDGWDEFLISPGVEFKYYRSINKHVSFGTGANLKKSNFISHIKILTNIDPLIGNVDFWRKFSIKEFSIPILIKVNKKFYGINSFITTGFYFGKLIKIKTEVPSSSGWGDYGGFKQLPIYTSNRFLNDLYFDFGISQNIGNNSSLLFSPIVNYRLSRAWTSYYHNRCYFGIKIAYQFNF